MSPNYLEQISQRLLEERKRLGFKSQEKMATALGVPSRTYWDREHGNVLPDAEFLATFCEIGGDAMYLLTGRRSPLHVGENWRPFSPAEQAAAAIQELKLTKDDSEMLIGLANRLAQK